MSTDDVQAILQQLDRQDKVLADIRSESRRTNGRVTALEKDKIERDERQKTITEYTDRDDSRRSRRQDTWHWRVTQLLTVAGAGGLMSQLPKLFH